MAIKETFHFGISALLYFLVSAVLLWPLLSPVTASLGPPLRPSLAVLPTLMFWSLVAGSRRVSEPLPCEMSPETPPEPTLTLRASADCQSDDVGGWSGRGSSALRSSTVLGLALSTPVTGLCDFSIDVRLCSLRIPEVKIRVVDYNLHVVGDGHVGGVLEVEVVSL